MKNFYIICVLFFVASCASAQSIAPYSRVYTILNTKCQNSTCHSGTASNASASLRFDTDSNILYAALFNVASPNYPSSVTKHEKLVKPQHPYSSFLLRKIAGATFDTDLTIDANEGGLMTDINGQQLSNKEIEFIRQWVMFGAKKTYTGSAPKPEWQLVSDFYDNPSFTFLNKPTAPAPGTGLRLRMGPIFIPQTGTIEQEWLQQMEVNFPYPAAITKIDGFMNQQSHHFLLFKFKNLTDAANTAADRGGNMAKVLITGNSSFDGEKDLTASWQDDQEITLPAKTAIFWDQTTILDMNYHVKNYNATSVLASDFYYNVYYQPRTSDLIEMKSALVNNVGLFLTSGTQVRDYNDESNNGAQETRYLWNMTSHTHKYGTDYDIYVRDANGQIAEKIYEGFADYANGGIDIGYYAWDHPSSKYFDTQYPVLFGKRNGQNSGLVARTTWNIGEPLVTFGFTTNEEMQLFYYMYTNQDPEATVGINDTKKSDILFSVVPNPVNNEGKLVYTLNKASKVEANIVDITGKMVAQLASENQTEGLHEVTIASEQLSSGIYFAKVTVDGTPYIKKFVVNQVK